jgi:hypothetical protein
MRKPLLETTNKVPDQVTQRDIDPSLFMSNVHQLDETIEDFCIRHVLQIDGVALGVLPEPGFLKVGVDAFDDVGLLILECRDELIFGEREDCVVEFFPEEDSPGGEFVDWFAEFGADGDDTAGGTLVRLFPVFVIETRCIDNSLFSLQRQNVALESGTAREVLASRAVMTREPKRTPSKGMQG